VQLIDWSKPTWNTSLGNNVEGAKTPGVIDDF